MIVTVTANPAVDKRLVISGFRAGGMNRATVERVDIGGKGINVARNLARLGCDVLATGFVAAVGTRDLTATLGADGVHHDFVQVPGEVRTNLKILDPAVGLETEINESGPMVAPDAIATLTDKVRVLARECQVMVFSGSLPPGVPEDLYAQFIRLASAAGVRTVLDTAGVALEHGIAATPDIVKPNRVESEALLRVQIRDDSDVAAAARQILDLGARTAVISLSAEGAVGASRNGMWRARPPRIATRRTVGAGDAMVAALAYGLQCSFPLAHALRFASALASAAAASAAPLPVPGRMETLLPQVAIESLTPDGVRIGFPGMDR